MTPAKAAADRQEAARLEDVHVVFASLRRPPVWALRGLSLSIPPGAVMGLLGPNGAGKTTCISCLLSLLTPHAGVVFVAGKRVSDASPRAPSSCGVLLEDTRLPPFLSVAAALRTACDLRAAEHPSAEIDRVVALGRIGDLLRRTVATLSKGQARKVGLAAALIGDPRLLVLDEPSAGLDVEARVEFEQVLLGLRDGERTILLASHLLGDVESTCTDVAVVQEGRVVLAGRTAELLEEARRGRASDVHVDSSASPSLDKLGLGSDPSRYPGLVVVRSTLPDEELFAVLASARIVPRRVEPRANMLSVYLETTRRSADS